MAVDEYAHNVFVNCPFDDEYRPVFDAIVFAVHDCGYISRCSLEIDDGSEVRIENIIKMIGECKFGIHDISRTQSDPGTGLPRFNMPLELGLFLGAKRFGRPLQKAKSCLILDVEKYRYQKFISDIAGQDIGAHGGEASKAIRVVRDWLSNAPPKDQTPGGRALATRYRRFREELPALCAQVDLEVDELTFKDYVVQVESWLKLNPQLSAPPKLRRASLIRFGAEEH
jgi:hypothetical protein